MSDICMKYNTVATNDPCALCGERTDPRTGPELFLDGTESLVCDVCALVHAPELLFLRDILTNVEAGIDLSWRLPGDSDPMWDPWRAGVLRVLERLSGRDYNPLRQVALQEPRGASPDRLALLEHQLDRVPF